MDKPWDITLAVVSDLHCHEASVTQESWLIAGDRRVPAGSHPIQALISLIKGKSIRAEVLICPGDLANKSSSPGMMQSWDHLRELKVELQSGLLLATIGNHDVDSRKSHGNDPFEIPRTLHPDFPTSQEVDRASFWANGFYFKKGPNDTDFLILNTVISHNDEAEARRGTFSIDRIKFLDTALENRAAEDLDSQNVRHRIAIMHHHPLLHSTEGFDSSDVLEYGDQLLAVLGKHGYRFVIHGHRHDPRITRQPYGTNDCFVFAAGSFSAILKELSTWTRNLFHIVKMRRDPDSGNLTGMILSWEYHKGLGWRESTSASAALPHIVRFCAPKPEVSIEDIKCHCASANGALLRSLELKSNFPTLDLLMPAELQMLRDELMNNGIKLVISPDGTVDYLGYPDLLSV